MIDASRPTSEEGRQYHINCSKGDLSPYVLLPGDPFRIPIIGSYWDSYREVAHHREFWSAVGKYKGVDVSACSTGIGGPSTEIAVNELAVIGCNTFIRVGTAGALISDAKCGEMIISTGAIRFDGSSSQYVWPEYPAVSNYEVVMALIEACESLGFGYHLGITASVSSFYAGQARPSYNDYFPSAKQNLVEDLNRAGVVSFEMESGTLLTLASIFGLRAGTVCAVNANRVTNEWKVGDNEKNVALVGNEAIRILAAWDKTKTDKGRKYFFPSLK